MSGQTNIKELTGRFIGRGSGLPPNNRNGIERAKINTKKVKGDFSDDTSLLMSCDP
ncbi:hypothetical protein [Methanosarcina mazei]|jgi:hypothetical protein|uniref:Uncharacterized protein n=1 Tax=Methanosarcina mazei Tuc01 TaxID=1236903 RepID=M1Q743_METMZ|nr:hypothetical protein [Methanosarcina mazei]AGF95948.1 hypothetical protein MmTuc01_0517 [Methanosarcina mazei Tuc01]MDO5841143.1 hypothetical protein [Methanosarcina mazei]MDY0246547.1 hypothetical protein [Methanosarcina mazei]WIM43769.1 hypothetical protein PSF70_02760 [Methanosarcina mazei]BBL63154.1 hypothetical protein MmazTMA_01310 [Methanosarcina mazei]